MFLLRGKCGRKIINHEEKWESSSHNGVCCLLHFGVLGLYCLCCCVWAEQGGGWGLVRRRLFTDNFHSRGGGLVHTMDELHFTGNCLKGSRPILSFDPSFDQNPHSKVIKELLIHIFGVPKAARRSKPFIDHVLSFTYTDGKIWFRNFQVVIPNPPFPFNSFVFCIHSLQRDKNEKTHSLPS